jgi:hypothetical protein
LLGLKNGVIDPPHHPPLFCFSLSILLLLSPAIKLTGTWVDNRKRNGRTLTAPLGGGLHAELILLRWSLC